MFTSKKGCGPGDTPGPAPLPAGCTVVSGGQASAEWLHCWRTNSGDFLNLSECLGCLQTCPIADADETTLANNCKNQPTVTAKLKCKMDAINDKMVYPQDGVPVPEGKVSGKCGNFMECLKNAANACGITTNREAGCLAAGNCHAWVETDVDDNGDGTADRRCVMNPQNSIMYCCPIGSLP